MREKAGPEAQGAGPRGPTSAASPLAARASRAGSLPPEECAERLGERRARGGFYDCGWRSRLPWRPTQRCEPPAALAAALGSTPAQNLSINQQPWREGLVLLSLQMGCSGREVLAGGNQREPPPPPPPGRWPGARVPWWRGPRRRWPGPPELQAPPLSRGCRRRRRPRAGARRAS